MDKMSSGRFREFYYWDTYWIIKALLRCDMAQTVRGIIENFLLMVQSKSLTVTPLTVTVG